MASTFRLKNQSIPLDLMHRDSYALIMHGLANMCRVAQSEDAKHAIAACQWLVAYGEGLMESKKASQRLEKARVEAAKGHPADREALLGELRGLYAQALGTGALIVEATAESEPTSSERT